MKKLYIFDFDGTLADTLPLAFMCFRETFLKFNQTLLSNTEIEALFGSSEQNIIQNFVKGDEQTKRQAVRFFYTLYQANHAIYAHCPTEIITLLKHLKQQQKILAIFTGKGRESLEYSLNAFQLKHYFNITVSDDDISHSKPAPDGLLKILNDCQILPEQAIYFGDSEADLLSGKKANVETHKIDWITHPYHILDIFKK